MGEEYDPEASVPIEPSSVTASVTALLDSIRSQKTTPIQSYPIPEYQEPRYQEPRYEEHRYQEPRYRESQYEDSRSRKRYRQESHGRYDSPRRRSMSPRRDEYLESRIKVLEDRISILERRNVDKPSEQVRTKRKHTRRNPENLPRELSDIEIEKFIGCWTNKYACKFFVDSDDCRFSKRNCKRLHDSATNDVITLELRKISLHKVIDASPLFSDYIDAISDNPSLNFTATVLAVKKHIEDICGISYRNYIQNKENLGSRSLTENG